MKKIVTFIVLTASIIAAVCLTCFLESSVRYSECVVSKRQFEDMIARRTEETGLLKTLFFDEAALFLDNASGTFYYSLVEGNSSAYDPTVKIKGNDKDLAIAFLRDKITERGIQNNQTITILAYTDDVYCKYYLKCTTLPLMNIVSSEEISDAAVPMQVTVFDNRQGATGRITLSEGTIHVRGASTRIFPKKSYRFSLTQKSIGGHERDNNVSLLGMRQDDDWLLYAAYNDQEKIRNVFSSNLWEYTCATDNAQGINTGMEYKYLELFLNGEYWGLYALGYPIDKKQMQLNIESGKEGLFKVIDWADRSALRLRNDGSVNQYEMEGTDAQKENWLLLRNYYNYLSSDTVDNEKLYAGIDLDNAIDIYLFLNLIQGLDNVSVPYVKNLFVSIRTGQEGLTALYAPWDMDITWGNRWTDMNMNKVLPYAISADVNCVMESGYLNQLIANNDPLIWEKIFDKYQQLRAAEWSEENINFLLDAYEADIYGSGAYLRDMKRWPEGTYEPNAADGLDTFRAYVMERLYEADLYYERLSALCGESVFIRRSAQYKIFEDCNLVIEINNKELLRESDYVDLFAYIGIDTDSVEEEVRLIITNPEKKRICYISTQNEPGNIRETNDETAVLKPDIRMAMVKDQTVEVFDFRGKYYTKPQIITFADLPLCMGVLSVMGCQSIVEINSSDIWQDTAYIELFEQLGVPEGTVNDETDFIVWNGLERNALALNNFHRSGSRSDTPAGVLSLYENESGEYGVYLDGMECFVSSLQENEEADIRMVLLDPDSYDVVDYVTVKY